MLHEKLSQEFSLKSIDKTRNFLIKKAKENDLMSKKKSCMILNNMVNYLF